MATGVVVVATTPRIRSGAPTGGGIIDPTKGGDVAESAAVLPRPDDDKDAQAALMDIPDGFRAAAVPHAASLGGLCPQKTEVPKVFAGNVPTGDEPTEIEAGDVPWEELAPLDDPAKSLGQVCVCVNPGRAPTGRWLAHFKTVQQGSISHAPTH